jgi:hypothetical protein
MSRTTEACIRVLLRIAELIGEISSWDYMLGSIGRGTGDRYADRSERHIVVVSAGAIRARSIGYHDSTSTIPDFQLIIVCCGE